MSKWIIKDWTGRTLWDGKEFDSFESGWDWICEQSPEPEKDSPEWLDGWYDDYLVEPKFYCTVCDQAGHVPEDCTKPCEFGECDHDHDEEETVVPWLDS